MAQEVEAKVRAIIAEQAGCDPAEVTPDSSPESLGMDSMALVETVFAIEEAFDIEVPFNANTPGEGGFDITSVGAIIRAVEDLVRERAA